MESVNTNNLYVIILGTNYSTILGIARALGEVGIKLDVYYVTRSKTSFQIVSGSKYVRNAIQIQTKDDRQIISSLTESYKLASMTYILLPVGDYSAALVDKNYDFLKNFFLMPYAQCNGQRNGVIAHLMDKSYQSKLAKKYGLPSANECVISLDDEIAVPDDVTYPCFVKTMVSTEGSKGEMEKCQDYVQLERTLHQFRKRNRKRNILVQEYLDIEVEYILSGICLDQTVIAPILVEKKRVARHSTGLTVYGTFCDLSVIEAWKEKYWAFLREFHYTGMFDLEIFLCKDGRVLFNEMNFRASGINYAITKAGANLPMELCVSLAGGNAKEAFDIKCDSIFFNDKVAWSEYQYGYISGAERKKMVKESDFCLLKNDADVVPYHVFLRYMYLCMVKMRLKQIAKWILRK